MSNRAEGVLYINLTTQTDDAHRIFIDGHKWWRADGITALPSGMILVFARRVVRDGLRTYEPEQSEAFYVSQLLRGTQQMIRVADFAERCVQDRRLEIASGKTTMTSGGSGGRAEVLSSGGTGD